MEYLEPNGVTPEESVIEMIKRCLIGIFLCLILTGSLTVMGDTQSGSPKIYIPIDFWDFGKVKEGTVPKHSFTVKNTGTAELVVNAYPSCRVCISPELSRNNIPPKGTAKLDITLFTTSKSGAVESFTMIQSNDPEQAVKKITIKAFIIGKPAL